ncbi:MAG: hypothetical protein V9F00_13375 [Nocardioides sp.]
MDLGPTSYRPRAWLRRVGFGTIGLLILLGSLIGGVVVTAQTLSIRSLAQQHAYCPQPGDADCLDVVRGTLVGGWRHEGSRSLDWQVRDLKGPLLAAEFLAEDRDRLAGVHEQVRGLLHDGDPVGVVTPSGIVFTSKRTLQATLLAWVFVLIGVGAGGYFLAASLFAAGHRSRDLLPLNAQGYFAQLFATLCLLSGAWVMIGLSGPPWLLWTGLTSTLVLLGWGMPPARPLSPQLVPSWGTGRHKAAVLAAALTFAGGAFVLVNAGNAQTAAYAATDTMTECGAASGAECLRFVRGDLRPCDFDSGGRYSRGWETCYLEYGNHMRAYGRFDRALRTKLEAAEGDLVEAYVEGERFHSVFLDGDQYAAYAWHDGVGKIALGIMLGTVSLALTLWALRPRRRNRRHPLESHRRRGSSDASDWKADAVPSTHEEPRPLYARIFRSGRT